jgi:hypothetical protein
MRGVEPSERGVHPTGPQHEVKPAASRTSPSQEANREPSPVAVGEGRGRGAELGGAPLRNPAAYGARNGGRASVGTGEPRLRPGSETPAAPATAWTGSGEPDKRSPRETGECGAGVGVARSPVEAGDNRTPAEGRGHTRSACPAEVSAGERRRGEQHHRHGATTPTGTVSGREGESNAAGSCAPRQGVPGGCLGAGVAGGPGQPWGGGRGRADRSARWGFRRYGIGWPRPPSRWCWNRSSRPTSGGARTGSGRSGEPTGRWSRSVRR